MTDAAAYQRATLRAIAAGGGKCTYQGEGIWQLADGDPLRVEWSTCAKCPDLRTLRALAAKGLARMRHGQDFTCELTAAGVRLAEEMECA